MNFFQEKLNPPIALSVFAHLSAKALAAAGSKNVSKGKGFRTTF
jgi:hypothetical protein